MKLQDRVKQAAEAAIQQKKTSCQVMSDKFECNHPTKIQMKIMFEDMNVQCWFEDVGQDRIKIWLQWGSQIHVC